jgi:hypothetical protein
LFGVAAQPAKDNSAAQAKTALTIIPAGSSQMGLDTVRGFFMDDTANATGGVGERFVRFRRRILKGQILAAGLRIDENARWPICITRLLRRQ